MALDALKSESSLLDGLLLLEADLDQAEAEKIVQPLAETGERFFQSEVGRAYLPVLRDRLFRLGYLRVLKGPEHVDETLKKAISKLQAEAGLTVDGWVGAQTWSALQELFAFEPSTYLEKWIDAKGMTPALRRAACLRLISLGFIPERTTAAQGPLESHLSEWRRILVLLDAPGISGETDLDSLELIDYLFDIDRLSRLVDGSAGRIGDLMDAEADPDGVRLRQFLSCLLKIELWLLGYEKIKPDGKPMDIRREPAKRRRGVGPKGRRTGPRGHVDSAAYQRIQHFWRDSRYQGVHGSEGAILLQCFRVLAEMEAEESAHTGQDEMAERAARATGVISQMEEEQANDEAHWKSASLVGRIWDGAKRVWRFLKRLVKGALRRVRLLVRAAYQLAADGFSLVRRAIRVFGEGMDLLISPEIKGSNDQIGMRHSADFDFDVFVARQAEPHVADQFIAGLRRQLGSLRAAMRMLKLIFQLAVNAARLAAGPWGWWKLLRALIDLNRVYDDEDRIILQEAFSA